MPLRPLLRRLLLPLFRPLLTRLEMPVRALSARVDAADAATVAVGQSIANIEAAIGRLAAANGVLANRIKDLEIEKQHSDVVIAALRNETRILTRGWLQGRIESRLLEQTNAPTADRS